MGNAATPSRMVDAEIAYLGRSVPLKIWVAPIPYPVLGRGDFMRRFHCRFYWDRQPPEFYVEAAPGGHDKVKSAPNPTIRPNKRRH